MKIGFIGLGAMGAPMAANLAGAGHDVTGFDPAGHAPKGITSAGSAAEAAMGASVVFLMLPEGETVLQVADRILSGMAANAVLVDCSTVDASTAARLTEEARRYGIACLDAPVSGGVDGAAAGTLTFMAGGDTEAFATVNPLFGVMGSHAIYCGGPGAGQAAKLCNSLVLGATMAVTCEAFALADRLGLGRKELYDVMATSTGQSWALTRHAPVPGVGRRSPADDGYRPGLSTDLILTEMRLALAAAETAGATLPVARSAAEEYRSFAEEHGGAGRDFSALLESLAPRKGSGAA